MNSTEKAALALMNEVRRQHGFEPCAWDEIEERDQVSYSLQVQAVIMSFQEQDK